MSSSRKPPYVRTEQILVREALATWRECYPKGRFGKRCDEVGERLSRLDLARSTKADVDAVVGNGALTRVGECSQCGEEASALVVVGESQDYESKTTCLCLACVRQAYAMLLKASQKS